MIPTLILFGLILGRWWRSAVVAGAVGWPALLVVTDTMDVEIGLLGAAGLAAANTGVGVLVHQGALRSFRLLRRPRVPDPIG